MPGVKGSGAHEGSDLNAAGGDGKFFLIFWEGRGYGAAKIRTQEQMRIFVVEPAARWLERRAIFPMWYSDRMAMEALEIWTLRGEDRE